MEEVDELKRERAAHDRAWEAQRGELDRANKELQRLQAVARTRTSEVGENDSVGN